ncbi:4Fe-4S binding protein [Caballeronia sp. LZ001]|uniref:4Fe-4S binding protein n=1 Tax=Caballeronia sp. LZ001 TaxID=3038553 RepID=UPI00286AB65E|nr:4Fe-4S binding protein [Caballeronia sp. LZ001]
MSDTKVIRQHLIDPEFCIRCNTCEESCPQGAILHDAKNYVVKADVCDSCGECISNCPTGAVDSWRFVGDNQRYSVEEQFAWTALPAETRRAEDSGAGDAPAATGMPEVSIYSSRAPAIGKVVRNVRVTAPGVTSNIHHIVIDFGRYRYPAVEGQSVGVLPPGTDAGGKPHTMRAYSIASSRDGEDGVSNTIALTVKRVMEDGPNGPRPGICSNYLCDLEVDAEVKVVGPLGASLLMPEDPDARIVMMCTGTGIAPMRAFVERRKRVGVGSKTMSLFYGGRTPGELPYLGELRALPASFIEVNVAFSRVHGQPKAYIQDLLLRRSEDVASALADEACHFYMCGRKGMERGVLDAFRDICVERGVDWELTFDRLHSSARLHIETY